MSIIELPIIEGANLLTNSREKCFMNCARKAYYLYELGIRSVHQADPLRKGSAFHLGIEWIKNGHAEQDAVDAVYSSYADSECPPWMEAEEFAVEVETMAAMVRGWARRWSTDLITQYVAVEISFDLPIVNPTTGRETPVFRSGGKIDGIAKLPDGRLALAEHKTVGESIEIGSDYWRKLQMDSQISRYVLAARAMGYDVQTTIYDVTRKPAIKPKKVEKADRALATSLGNYFGIPLTEMCPERETPKMFGARLLADMQERPDFYFQRCEIPRLDSDLEEFQKEHWTIQRNIRQAQLDQRQFGAAAWPRNTGACTSMGRCNFFDHCKSGIIDINNLPAGFRRATVLHEELGQAQEKSA